MDFSTILPPGVGIQPLGSSNGPAPRLEIWFNFATPQPAAADWIVDPSLASAGPNWFWIVQADGTPVWQNLPPGPLSTAPPPISGSLSSMRLGTAVVGRAVYSYCQGGNAGVDYQFRWTITDTLGNALTRTGLLLVGLTS